MLLQSVPTESVSAGFGSFIAVLYVDFIFKENT